MRKYLIPVVAATAILAAAGAYAANTTGTIKAMDAASHTVTLDNGQIYHLPATGDMTQLKVGEKVTVTFETKDGQHMASGVKAAK